MQNTTTDAARKGISLIMPHLFFRKEYRRSNIMEYFDELFSKLANIGNLQIAVIGDFTLDKFLFVDSTKMKVAPDTGKPVYHVMNSKRSPGSAGAVCKDLINLGVGKVYAVGFVGKDGDGYDSITEMERIGVNTSYLFSTEMRKTPTHTVVWENTAENPDAFTEQCEYHTINGTNTPTKIQQKIEEVIEALLDYKQLDAVVVVDSCNHVNRGVVCESIRKVLSDATEKHPETVFLCDSSRFVREFDGMILKCNEIELERSGDMVNKSIREACKALANEKNKPVIITSGENGSTLAVPAEKPFKIQARPVPFNVLDTRGAGDEYTAAFIASYCMGVSVPDAALLDTVGASLCCEQPASTGSIRMKEIQDALVKWLDSVSQSQKTHVQAVAGGVNNA